MEFFVSEGALSEGKGDLLMLGMVLGLTVVLAVCGGEDTTGTRRSPSGVKDGRIFVRNDTDLTEEGQPTRSGIGAAVDVRLELAGPEGAETFVNPRETKAVSDLIRGGTKVVVSVTARSSPDCESSSNFKPSTRVEVTVNGNVTIRLFGPLGCGQSLNDYEVLPRFP